MNQKYDNYFILFNNEKNVKFDDKKLMFNTVTIPCQEVKNKILYTFSNGEFYKLRGIE